MEALHRCAEALRDRGFSAAVFATKEEAAAYLNEKIDKTTVGFGGSATLQEMGLLESLSAHNEVISHWAPGTVDKNEVRRRAATTECYLSSVNGLSEQGEIVNIDGACNRVASTVYGHGRVFFVVGKNKLTADLEAAVYRARNVAAPPNAKRLGRKTPCAVKGDRCYDCRSPERICRNLSILWAPSLGVATEVVLIGEDLGF